VRTFQGDFSADFPIQLPDGQTARSGSKRFNFTLGSGSARIEVQSFNGDIHLARTKVTSAEEERRKREEERMKRRTPTPTPNPPRPPKGLALNLLDIEHLTEHALDVATKALKDTEKEWTTFEKHWKEHAREWPHIDPDEINEEVMRSLKDSLDSLHDRELAAPEPPLPPSPPEAQRPLPRVPRPPGC
jgi:hypothetical protein